LQAYAVCPYKFLLSGIHRLAPREESVPLQALDPLTRGRIYHSLLALFLRRALASKLLPLKSTSLAKAYSLADKVLSTIANEYHELLAPAIERVWDDEIELLRADLRGLLGQMAEHPDGYLPELIEYSFGLPIRPDGDSAGTRETAVLPEGFLVHGIADLVERGASGDLRITDHKTGKNRTEQGMIVGHGEVLQPVLYSLALENLLDATVKEARLSYCTATGGYTELVVTMNDLARHAATTVLQTIDESIEQGFLPTAPKEEGCKWCDFISVCGPNEEIRASRKSQAPLATLVQLREMV
jgi:RecB family exonuclease